VFIQKARQSPKPTPHPKIRVGAIRHPTRRFSPLTIFNKSSRLIEVSSDVVFDETNGSPREHVDLDDIDDVPTA
jgi:hypothetical protein